MAGCASLAISGIKNNCERSKGGIKNIWISPYNEANVSATSGTVTISEATAYKKFYVKKNTTSFTSTLTVDPANGVNFVTTVLSLVFTRMDSDKRVEMNALTVSDLHIVVEDANGALWFLGVNNPVTVTNGTGETGTAKTDGNRYTIEFTDESDEFPMELDTESATKIKAIVE